MRLSSCCYWSAESEADNASIVSIAFDRDEVDSLPKRHSENARALCVNADALTTVVNSGDDSGRQQLHDDIRIDSEVITPLIEQKSDPSFNCDDATTIIEKAICADSALSKLDGDLGRIYRQALLRDPSVKGSQIKWIKDRNSDCEADLYCLKYYTQDRIEYFNREMAGGELGRAKPPRGTSRKRSGTQALAGRSAN